MDLVNHAGQDVRSHLALAHHTLEKDGEASLLVHGPFIHHRHRVRRGATRAVHADFRVLESASGRLVLEKV